jgi:flagellar biosynthesis/type III secretory pathway protein FliH
MAVIQVPFGNSLSKISTPHGRVVQSTIQAEPVVDEAATIAAKQTMDAISNRLGFLEQHIQHELSSVQSKIIAVATEIAKEALGSDRDLIEQRVAHFADVLLKQIQPTKQTVIYVNVSCIHSLTRLLSESDRAKIEIQADSTIEPGDCRIETDGKGFLASLDSYLDAAAKKKNPSGRGGI